MKILSQKEGIWAFSPEDHLTDRHSGWVPKSKEVVTGQTRTKVDRALGMEGLGQNYGALVLFPERLR